MYTIKLLGGVGIDGPHGPVIGQLSQRRPLATLAVLAVAGARGCSRAKLAGLLWPDDDEAHARHHLSDALSRIRQVMGPLVVVTDGDMLWLGGHAIRTDVEQFEDAYRQGRLDDAVRLYGGPLLDGFYVVGAGPFEEWANLERARLGGAYASALERLAHIAASTGHHRASADWLRLLVAHDPYNSRIVLKLAAELEESGDRPNALRVVEEHDRRLRSDLDLEPDASVMRVLQRLRATPSPPAAAPNGRPFVPGVRSPLSVPGWRPRGFRRHAAPAAAGLLVVAGLAGAAVRMHARAEPDPDHWMVVPFTIVSGAPYLRQLADEIPKLAEMHLPAPPGAHVHERAAAAERWMSAGGRLATGLAEDRVMEVARHLGAGRVVLGTLGATDGRVTMVIRLLAVPSGDHRGVQTGSCPPESSGVLLDRMLDALRGQDAALTRLSVVH